ncbi:hypothetical protein [Photobacterium sp. 1_MG-2023]|uniref:hypothetical protein n=1 Tax=Photobacterium sp. 1_MG-2023 TaxID=3062646 RepID=UPI0026E3FAE1|nr:hypothetical protein [Photobacterium sp. 1_MG-2023]MDO6704957.1 hypothetical protein [Photobacterium sp. 1_MG-2023]
MVFSAYHDVETGDTKEVSTGIGEPEFKIVFKYANYEETKATVMARAKQVRLGSDVLDITMPARSSLMNLVAEGHLTLKGVGDVEDGIWRNKMVELSLSESGLQLRISCKPRSSLDYKPLIG